MTRKPKSHIIGKAAYEAYWKEVERSMAAKLNPKWAIEPASIQTAWVKAAKAAIKASK